jgi:hypothetical protein
MIINNINNNNINNNNINNNNINNNSILSILVQKIFLINFNFFYFVTTFCNIFKILNLQKYFYIVRPVPFIIPPLNQLYDQPFNF